MNSPILNGLFTDHLITTATWRPAELGGVEGSRWRAHRKAPRPDPRSLVFKTVFCIFTLIGATLYLGPVIGFSDSMIFLMSVPNIIGLYLLARVIKKEINGYWARIQSGEIEMVDKH